MSETIHSGHRERMRKRFLEQGPDGFADHELLEMLLYTAFPRRDTNRIAHGLLKEFGSLTALLEADPLDIAKTEGIGKGTAVFFAVAKEVFSRYEKERLTKKTAITSSTRAVETAAGLLRNCPVERFYVLCLDSRRRLLRAVKISEGTVTEAPVQPRQVVEAALKYRASGVIFCHNHPGGSASPSFRDIQLTESLRKLLEPIGIEVVDHIIIAEQRYFSFSEGDLLKRQEGS